MKARLLGGIAALVVAVIGTVLLLIYVQSADKRALANTETQEVYVVQKAVPAGTTAANLGDSVVKKAIPKGVLASDSVANLSELGAKVAAVNLVPGEQLLATRMVEPGALAAPGRVNVPDGLQELTVKLAADRVVGGTLRAGDTAGVLLSFPADDKAGTPAQTQQTFHKVLVTAVQYSTGATAQGEGTPTASTGGTGMKTPQGQAGGEYLVTIARTSEDVERIVFAVEFGTVYMSKEPTQATEGGSTSIDRTKVFR